MMQIRVVKRYSSLIIFACLFLAACAKKQSKHDNKILADGISYQYIKQADPAQSIHVLRVDPTRVAIIPAKAQPFCLGRETVSAIASRYNALAAVNGGFFEESGVPAGALKIWDRWFSDPKRMRGTIAWNDGATDAFIDRLGMQWEVIINDQKFPVTRLNHARAKEKAIVYNQAFNTSTKTNSSGTEIIIHDNRVIDIQHGKGNATIPNDGFVYSVAKDAPVDLANIQAGMSAELRYSFVMPETSENDGAGLDAYDFIVGGTPVLVSQGEVNRDFQADKILQSFIDNRHARTAVGIMPDGSWIFVVVDGKASKISEGMTIQELADFMQRFGCIKALNLDGGSSSTMWFDGKVVNIPGAHWWFLSMQGEDKVSDAILMMPRKR